jgi:hypothetical protein
MASVALLVLSTVNAPYGTSLAAQELATLVSDPESASRGDASAFAFFSEVPEGLQRAFLDEMGLDNEQVGEVAARFEELAGYPLPLSRMRDGLRR